MTAIGGAPLFAVSSRRTRGFSGVSPRPRRHPQKPLDSGVRRNDSLLVDDPATTYNGAQNATPS